VSDIEREKEAGSWNCSIITLIANLTTFPNAEAERKRSRLAATAAGQAAMTQRAEGA